MGLQSSTLKAIDAAKSSLGDLVVDLILRKRTVGTYVPGSPVPYNNSDFNVKGAFTKYALKEIDGNLVKMQDIRIIMFPDVTRAIPEQNDLVIFGEKQFRVMHNDPTYVGSEIALNTVQVRPV